MKALAFNSDHELETCEVDSTLIHEWQSNEAQFLWIDVEGKEAVDTQFLKSQFNLNDLALTDSIRERHPPKIESFSNNTFVLLRTIELSLADNLVIFSQVSLFIGDRFLITRHFGDNSLLKDLWQKYTSKQLTPDLSAIYIFYRLFRGIADQYVSNIIAIEERLEIIEDALDKDEKDTYLPELISLNTTLRKIVRNLDYMVLVSSKLLKDSSISEKYSHEFIDVYEQIERAQSLAEMYQALCADLMNAYISVTSHRVNKVVKILTIVTVLFVPLGFIAGLYGMNFEYMPELKHHYGYFYVLGFMIVLEIALIVLLKKLKWF